MVWVDAFAILVGTLMLLATVGGVVFVEPEPKPLEWDYSFFEATAKHKHCAGLRGGVREGCTDVVDTVRPPEGVPFETVFGPVDRPNVTSVRFTLTWVDNVPVTETPDCRSHKDGECDRAFDYDADSVDLLRLTVWPPMGDAVTIEGTNDVSTRFGSIGIGYDFLEMPDAGSVFAFSADEAMAQVVPQFTEPGHGALGEWRAEVVVVRAGDQEGTVPLNPCLSAFGEINQTVPEPLVEPIGTHCYTDDGPQNTWEESEAAPLMRSGGYTSSYDDGEQAWILEMAIRAYDSQVTFG